MPKNLIFTDKEAAFLKELIKNEVPFMIVGLSAAALQGAPVVTQDIDLWFKDITDPKIKRALNKVGGSYIPPIMLNPPMFVGENVRLFDIVLTMHGLGEFDEEIGKSVEVLLGKLRVKVLPLEQISKSKKAINQQKDKLTIPVLEDALLAIRSKK